MECTKRYVVQNHKLLVPFGVLGGREFFSNFFHVGIFINLRKPKPVPVVHVVSVSIIRLSVFSPLLHDVHVVERIIFL